MADRVAFHEPGLPVQEGLAALVDPPLRPDLPQRRDDVRLRLLRHARGARSGLAAAHARRPARTGWTHRGAGAHGTSGSTRGWARCSACSRSSPRSATGAPASRRRSRSSAERRRPRAWHRPRAPARADAPPPTIAHRAPPPSSPWLVPRARARRGLPDDLGVGQVVLDGPTSRPASRDLVSAGYMRTFEERGLANHEAKAVVQGASRGALDMVHLNVPGPTLAVELTSYGDALLVARPSSTPPLGTGTCPDRRSRREQGLLERRPGLPRGGRRKRSHPRHHGPGAAARGSARPADDGRRPDDRGRRGARAGDRPVDGRGRGSAPARRGRDLTRVTAAWKETIADRRLRVAIVAGPCGELVELLEVPRTPRGANDERES